MSTLSKVRVQLLDEATGNVIEEVDVLTSADAVKFADGQTFQQKLDAGTLKGPKGDTGATGATGPQGPQGLKGDTGATGSQGPQGVAGADGKTWHISTGTPAAGLGVVGDMHLNTSTWDIREKTAASTWTVRGNIKGATGNTGATGATGPQGPKGDKGDPGDSVKFGTTLATAADVKVFFKKI